MQTLYRSTCNSMAFVFSPKFDGYYRTMRYDMCIVRLCIRIGLGIKINTHGYAAWSRTHVMWMNAQFGYRYFGGILTQILYIQNCSIIIDRSQFPIPFNRICMYISFCVFIGISIRQWPIIYRMDCLNAWMAHMYAFITHFMNEKLIPLANE